MAAHPDDAAKVRAANRSYVFFGITGLTNKGEPPIIGTAGGLHQPAAAITKAVARLCVAELPRLARIAETINALRDRFRPARIPSPQRLPRSESRRPSPSGGISF